MKKIDKLKKQVTTALAEAKKAKKKQVVVFTMNRESFRKTLKSQSGFGSQDLKPTELDLYNWMQKKFGKTMTVTAGGTGKTAFDTQFTVKL